MSALTAAPSARAGEGPDDHSHCVQVNGVSACGARTPRVCPNKSADLVSVSVTAAVTLDL
jgi:hypothetical protein